MQYQKDGYSTVGKFLQFHYFFVEIRSFDVFYSSYWILKLSWDPFKTVTISDICYKGINIVLSGYQIEVGKVVTICHIYHKVVFTIFITHCNTSQFNIKASLNNVK